MFREPEEETASKVVTRVDKVAATSRSSIRRESTLRPGRYNAIPSPRSRNARAYLLEDYRTRASRPQPVAEEDHDELEREIERLRSRREARSRIRWGSLNENDGSDMDRRHAGEELLRDALQHDRPGQRMRLLHPPRESALRFEVAPSPPLSDVESRTTSPRRRTLTRTYMPSPPYVPNDQRTIRPIQYGPILSVPGAALELTPGFAPAQGAYEDLDRPAGEVPTSTTTSAAANEDHLPDSETTPPPDTWESSYPPLRRVGHLSPRPLIFRHDGLGDRQRSPISSADDSNAEEDTWETLLTTMEEDEHQPSVDSSFTSAIASASTSHRSDSASRSGRSSQTTATSLSDLERSLDPSQPCEPDDMNTETDAQYDPSMRSMIRRAREPRRLREQHDETHSLDEQRMVLERVHGAVREDIASAERRTAAAERRTNAAEARLRRIESQAAETEAELAQMQTLIDRLARREEIPNEMWAAAGLPRISRSEDS